MLAAQSRPAVSGLDSSSLAWGKHPIAPGGFPPYSYATMINHKRKPLTFGDLIAAVYAACGRQKAEGIVRLAVKARLVEFRGDDRFVILEPGPDNIFSSL